MTTRDQHVKDYAQTLLDHKDQVGHDAVMASIDDYQGALNKFPTHRSSIRTAKQYAEQQLKMSGYGS